MKMSQSWSDIHRIAAAESMRAHLELGIDTTQPIDPFEALQRSGVLVMRQQLDRLSGAYLPADVAAVDWPGVLINVGHPPSRQRYTAAHELWHHRRDHGIAIDAETEWLARGEDGYSDRERLAEAFASWFLMPKRLVETTVAMLGATARSLDEKSVYALSLELGTSYEATVHRLYGLRMISPRLRERLLGTKPQSIKQSLGHADVAADPWRDVRLIGPLERERAVGAVEGDVVILELPEIPSSGYLWHTKGLPDNINLVRDEYLPNSKSELGGSGVHRFVFSVVQSGAYPIRFELSRPWQSGMSVEVRDIEVVAQSIPALGVDPDDLVEEAA